MAAPLIYLDSSCFGALVSDARVRKNVEDSAHMQSLLMAIQFGQFRFVTSDWLAAELKLTKPPAKRRVLFDAMPMGAGARAYLSAEVQQLARRLEAAMNIDFKDSLHVACAVDAAAELFVTRDKDLFEKCRQKRAILFPLRPLILANWVEGLKRDDQKTQTEIH